MEFHHREEKKKEALQLKYETLIIKQAIKY